MSVCIVCPLVTTRELLNRFSQNLTRGRLLNKIHKVEKFKKSLQPDIAHLFQLSIVIVQHNFGKHGCICQSRHNFNRFAAVEGRILHSQPFTNSGFRLRLPSCCISLGKPDRPFTCNVTLRLVRLNIAAV
jgi:hypothetical protein